MVSDAEADIAFLKLTIEKLRRELYGWRSERKQRLPCTGLPRPRVLSMRGNQIASPRCLHWHGPQPTKFSFGLAVRSSDRRTALILLRTIYRRVVHSHTIPSPSPSRM